MSLLQRLKDPAQRRWILLIVLAALNLGVNFTLGRLEDSQRRPLQLATYVIILVLTFIVAGGFPGLKVAFTKPKLERDRGWLVQDVLPFILVGLKAFVVVIWIVFPTQVFIDGVLNAIDGIVILIQATGGRPKIPADKKKLRQTIIDGSLKILQGRGNELINQHALDYAPGTLNKFFLVPRNTRPDLVSLPDKQAQDGLPTEEKIKSVSFAELVNTGRRGWLITGAMGSGKTSALISILADMLRPFADEKFDKYRDDDKSPIPLKIELSDWPSSGKPFGSWLLDEIHEVYKVGAAGARMIAEGDGTTNSFVLLLDGLDEMSGSNLRACIYEINRFLDNINLEIVRPRLVVCCRLINYLEAIEMEEIDPEAPKRMIARKLQLDGAVELLPVEDHQIKEYLATAFSSETEQLTPDAIDINEEYLNIFRRPLTLALAIKGNFALNELQTVPVIPNNVQDGSDANSGANAVKEAIEQTIYQRFIDVALQEYARSYAETKEGINPKDYEMRVRQRLAWLAQKMPSKKKIFTIEDLQPSWLKPTPQTSFFHPAFLFWLIVYLIASRVTVSVIVTFGAGLSTASPFENIVAGVLAGLFIATFDLVRFYMRRDEADHDQDIATAPKRTVSREPLLWLLRPLLVRAINWVNARRDGTDQPMGTFDPSYWSNRLTRIRRGAIGFIVVFAGTSFFISLHFIAIQAHSVEPGTGVLGSTLSATGMVRGMFMSLFLAFFLGVGRVNHSLYTDITMIERVKAQWGDAILHGIQWAIIAGLIVGSIAATLYDGTERDTIRQWLTYSTQEVFNVGNSAGGYFIVGGLVAMVGGFITGLLSGVLRLQDKAERESFDPNRGLVYSLGNAGRNMIVLGSFFALALGSLMLIATGNLRAAARVALSGLSAGVFALPQYGALAIINHIALKLIFYVRDLPLRYLGSLDGFSRSRLIGREGRGYAFYHNAVFEHFREREKRYFERLLPGRLMKTLGTISLGTALFVSLPAVHALLMRIDVPENALYVTGDVVRSEHEYAAGQQITIRSKGMFRTGAYVGYVPPEGTETGIFGAPIGNTYDIGAEPTQDGIPGFAEGDARHVPHGGLLCRVPGEVLWRGCAYLEEWGTPYDWRSYTFTMPYSGALEFRVNDFLLNDTSGSFAVVIESGPVP